MLKFFLNLVKKEYSKQKKLQKTKKVAKIDKIEEGEFDFEEPSEKEIESEIEEEIVENEGESNEFGVDDSELDEEE